MTTVVSEGAGVDAAEGVVVFEYDGHLFSKPDATALAARANNARVYFIDQMKRFHNCSLGGNRSRVLGYPGLTE